MTVGTVHISRSRIFGRAISVSQYLSISVSVIGVPNLGRRPDWTSRYGICVCSSLAVYRTSVYSLLKCIEYLMYTT